MITFRQSLFAILAFCVLGTFTAPAPAADQAKVNAAIAAGGEYLRGVYTNFQGGNPNIVGAAAPAGGHGLGAIALCGMAMLEAGVKIDDPAMKNVINYVRQGAMSQTRTYHVVLSIMFLDRLGDPADIPIIQFLGVRLYYGMTANGGWEYDCHMEIQPAEEARLRAAYAQGTPAQGSGTSEKPKPKADTGGFPQAAPGAKKDQPEEPNVARLHPENAKYFNAARGATGRQPVAGDNSNTQFGLIGLWISARHGVPADDAFARVEARFLTTQSRADAGWGYSGSLNSGSTLAMTCAGLLGLAVGAGRGKRAADGPGPKDPVKPKSNDPFYNAPGKKDDKTGELSMPNAPGTIVPGIGAAERKKAIEAALATVGRVLQASPGGANLNNYVGLGDEYYTLFSVERVAVAYGLETIGGADWHDWGCTWLLGRQTQNGSWSGKEGAEVGTAFALLFLTKSNFVADLSSKIRGAVKDPGKSELRAGVDPGLFAPKNPHSSPGAGGKQMGDKSATTPASIDPPVAPPSGAEVIADALVAAKPDQWKEKLTAARDTKGAEYTAGLARAIARLDAERQKEARDALAERLTRMTANTLRTMLKDNEAELRRAAALACAMKEDKTHIPDLIDRITDPTDIVVRAVRASLKSLTGKDFGPTTGADDAAKTKAKADWNRWYLTEGK